MPALFAILDDPVFNEHEIWVCEDEGSGLEIDAMLVLIGPIFLRVPFKAHFVIRITVRLCWQRALCHTCV